MQIWQQRQKKNKQYFYLFLGSNHSTTSTISIISVLLLLLLLPFVFSSCSSSPCILFGSSLVELSNIKYHIFKNYKLVTNERQRKSWMKWACFDITFFPSMPICMYLKHYRLGPIAVSSVYIDCHLSTMQIGTRIVLKTIFQRYGYHSYKEAK